MDCRLRGNDAVMEIIANDYNKTEFPIAFCLLANRKFSGMTIMGNDDRGKTGAKKAGRKAPLDIVLAVGT